MQQVTTASQETKSLSVIRADDFCNMLIGAGICNEPECLPNLTDFFKLSVKYPEVLIVDKILQTLVELSENENVMTYVI